MQRLVSLTISVFIIIVLGSCGKHQSKVEDRLIPYFDRFADESSKRGVVFDYVSEEIEGSIRSIDSLIGSSGVLGLCQPETVRKPFSEIVIDEEFWSDATDLQREYVVFHELGHCFLDRDHPSPAQADSLGNCMSIMAAGNATCNGIDVYSEERRKMLLDELFSN